MPGQATTSSLKAPLRADPHPSSGFRETPDATFPQGKAGIRIRKKPAEQEISCPAGFHNSKASQSSRPQTRNI